MRHCPGPYTKTLVCTAVDALPAASRATMEIVMFVLDRKAIPPNGPKVALQVLPPPFEKAFGLPPSPL